MKKYLFLFALLLGVSASAESIRTIRDVDIRVELNQDGSAWITQRWDAEAGGSGTEFYIPVGNLGPMTIGQLQVSEDGVPYESLGSHWDVDRDRSYKKGKCGIVPKRNGVELCWGLGETGDHLWEARFFVTGLVQAYDDADGFNFQFVNKGMKPAPKHARVTIVPAFDCPSWNYDNTRVWAFGFYGEINVTDGAVVAETSTSMSYDSSLIALVKFEKGIFSPTVYKGGSFQDFLDEALEGSSYGEDEDEEVWPLLVFGLLFIGFFLVLIALVVASALGYKWKKNFFGKTKIIGWYRDVPLGGNLFATHYALTKGRMLEYGNHEANNLIGAFFLRWVMDGKVVAVVDPGNPRRVNLSFQADSVSADDVEESLYQMAKEAAGKNEILEKGEFEKWSTAHYRQMMAWPDRAIARGKRWFKEKGYLDDKKFYGCTPTGQAEACHAVEFKNFLKNFTLSDERTVNEVGLWKEYLVYAQLFGIADKVADQFKRLYPAQFEELAHTTGIDPTTLYYTMRWTSRTSAKAFMSAASKAGSVSGHGGHSSFGGGGGFSGGGFGGGGR